MWPLSSWMEGGGEGVRPSWPGHYKDNFLAGSLTDEQSDVYKSK